MKDPVWLITLNLELDEVVFHFKDEDKALALTLEAIHVVFQQSLAAATDWVIRKQHQVHLQMPKRLIDRHLDHPETKRLWVTDLPDVLGQARRLV